MVLLGMQSVLSSSSRCSPYHLVLEYGGLSIGTKGKMALRGPNIFRSATLKVVNCLACGVVNSIVCTYMLGHVDRRLRSLYKS